ncbi:MAG: hypothetical protein KAJ72_04060 [Candidatus Heimdallarchaeota archaeon]|nr:hypothetical protein [Candidatus Heimdallarchaeota archaeon]
MHLKDKIGKKITLKGKISDIPWQHMIKDVENHNHNYYFDLEDGAQIVIYSKAEVLCSRSLLVTGEVIEVRGKSKRLSKIDDVTYVEYHIIIDDWECLD